jgi:hypothetical protein
MKTPNTKHQTPNSFQTPNTNPVSGRRQAPELGRMKTGWSLVFGSWCLFGVSFHPSPTIS